MKKRLLPLFVVIAIFSSACVATGNLDLYPRRQIDRPYTIPQGLATWEPQWHSDSIKSENDSENSSNFSALVWTQSLSDDLNIVWYPLPLFLRYQIKKTDHNVYGVSTGVSTLSYKSDNKWTVGIGIYGYQRHSLNDWLALVTTLSFEHVVRTKPDSGNSWGADLSVGPLFQVSDDIAILPGIHYSYEHNYPAVIDIPDTLERKTYRLMPLSISAY
jgi:hypothetical protein